jgi:hypothetical protein
VSKGRAEPAITSSVAPSLSKRPQTWQQKTLGQQGALSSGTLSVATAVSGEGVDDVVDDGTVPHALIPALRPKRPYTRRSKQSLAGVVMVAVTPSSRQGGAKRTGRGHRIQERVVDALVPDAT